MYRLSDYGYDLPEELIAQHPVENREESRLMMVDIGKNAVFDRNFRDIESILVPGDVVVINNTRVIPARLKGKKESGGKVEVLVLDYIGGIEKQNESGLFECECMIRASKSPRPGTRLRLGDNLRIEAEVVENNGPYFIVRFLCEENFAEVLEREGEIPLPPYIKRDAPVKNIAAGDDGSQHGGAQVERRYCSENIERIDDGCSVGLSGRPHDSVSYQTVYASEKGAVAAPTAGLHFTESLMRRLEQAGVEFVTITLHVGIGTFVPVKVDDIRDHRMHSEFFSITRSAAETINMAKREGRRVVAVGTTSVRTIEYATDQSGVLRSGSGMCDLFIYPGYRFRTVSAIITNFHLPESTLIMLVSAFAGRDLVLQAYREAVEKRYRFFSYGDAMFLGWIQGRSC